MTQQTADRLTYAAIALLLCTTVAVAALAIHWRTEALVLRAQAAASVAVCTPLPMAIPRGVWKKTT